MVSRKIKRDGTGIVRRVCLIPAFGCVASCWKFNTGGGGRVLEFNGRFEVFESIEEFARLSFRPKYEGIDIMETFLVGDGHPLYIIRLGSV